MFRFCLLSVSFGLALTSLSVEALKLNTFVKVGLMSPVSPVEASFQEALHPHQQLLGSSAKLLGQFPSVKPVVEQPARSFTKEDVEEAVRVALRGSQKDNSHVVVEEVKPKSKKRMLSREDDVVVDEEAQLKKKMRSYTGTGKSAIQKEQTKLRELQDRLAATKRRAWAEIQDISDVAEALGYETYMVTSDNLHDALTYKWQKPEDRRIVLHGNIVDHGFGNIDMNHFQWVAVDFRNLKLSVVPVPGDGNCGWHSLGNAIQYQMLGKIEAIDQYGELGVQSLRDLATGLLQEQTDTSVKRLELLTNKQTELAGTVKDHDTVAFAMHVFYNCILNGESLDACNARSA